MFISSKSELKEGISFWNLYLMSISGTLGAGLFILIGEGAAIAGHLLPLSFLLAGLIGYLINFVYAELASSMPSAGGGQVYLRTAFGDKPALFVVHWLTWMAEIAFTAINALGFGTYMSLIIPVNPLIISILSIIILTIINLFGVEKVGKLEAMIGCALLISLLGIFFLLINDFTVTQISTTRNFFNLGWIQAVPLIFVIFIGSEDIVAISSEIKNKEKSLPRALFSTAISMTFITVAFSFFFLQVFPIKEIVNNPQPFSLIGSKGGLANVFTLGTVIFACISSLFLSFLAGTRTAYALSKGGEIPKIFSKTNKHKVPYVSILLCGIFLLLLTLSRSAKYVAYIANIGFFLECIFISFALMKLRTKRPHLARPFLIKLYPFIPIAVIVFCIIFLLLIDLRSWLMTFLLALVGILVYLFDFFEKKRIRIAITGIKVFLLLCGLIFITFSLVIK